MNTIFLICGILTYGNLNHEVFIKDTKVNKFKINLSNTNFKNFERNLIGCPQEVLSLTDASFESGSYTIQAGFGESEAAATTYSLPIDSFPVKLDFAEILFATSNATEVTTTEWSISFYEGTPENGELIRTYFSDGKLLPHLVMPAGTTGTIIQFAIDSNDPEQIYFNDNGSQNISIAFRIEKHHNQNQNPCIVGPPTNSNAFPCTDISGLDSPSNNFLDLIDCGIFGCGSDWTSFQNLPQLCTPSGDWVMRMAVTPFTCFEEVGACCLDPFTCLDSIETFNCQEFGGTFQGSNSICENVSCLTNKEYACCIPATQACVELELKDCTAVGGIFDNSQSCDSLVCFPSGSCCLTDGSCLDNITQDSCEELEGIFQGNNSKCFETQCPQPSAACCVESTGNCIDTTESICNAVAGIWYSDFSCSNEQICLDTCIEDIAPEKGDGTVNTLDLLEVVSNFGICNTSDNCSTDLNKDNIINVLDLLIIVSNFGDCN